MPADGRVPRYLGRVLDEGGEAAGSCFEVSPGVLVTAWHVLDDLGRVVGDVVEVDPLGGGYGFPVAVRATDPLHDLAVLVAEGSSLGRAVVGLSPSDEVAMGAQVVVTGVSEVPDSVHSHEWLDAPGSWAGGTTRDREVPLARVRSPDVVPGMSGAPVRLLDGDRVVGVVSGRYNSADGWLRDTVWVARVEDVERLLAGVSPVRVARERLAGPVSLSLAVDQSSVRLRGPRGEVSGRHRGVSVGLSRRVAEVRQRRGHLVRAVDEVTGEGAGMTLVSRLLGESFLPGSVADELAWELERAEASHERVLMGVDAPGVWGGLPWEVLAAPVSGQPLALRPLVDVYRAHPTRGKAALGRPLRILVAIASPDTGGGELLDYEKEMRSVVAAVRGARQATAQVRFVPFASTAEIRAALVAEPAHVLHVSGHGEPGALALEDDEGNARPVDAKTFVEEAIPPGRMPAVVALAACHTDAAIRDQGEGEAPMASFAAQVAAKGPVAVIATEASVTDEYATRFFARVYSELAAGDRPDVVAAVSEARRVVQRQLAASTIERDQVLAGFDEWATVTVLAGGPAVLAFDEASPAEAPGAAGSRVVHVGEVLGRGPGEFVGRRREQRLWPAELLATDRAGMVLFGIGGVGKTTLATELTRRVRDREPARVSMGLVGFVSADRLLSAVCDRLRTVAAIKNLAGIAGAIEVAARSDLPAEARLEVLRDVVFPTIPVLVVLDNFEDNLAGPGPDGIRPLRDETLAGLLAVWVRQPGDSRLLITSRYRIRLPGGPYPSLVEHQVGPMTLAETRKLMWALPQLDALDAQQAEQVWRILGGHPRSLEYLDALLAGGRGRFPDITKRLTRALEAKLGALEAEAFLQAGTDLQTALTETVALAADDVLIGALVAQVDRRLGARRLLIGASVYRRPVDRHALVTQTGDPDPTAGFTPDRKAANEAIDAVLTEAGITARPVDLDSLDDELQARLAPHVAALQRTPTPPFREPDGLDEQIAVCQAASLLDVHDDGRFSVHRWTATILAEQHATSDELDHAHQRAAAYWRWHVEVWPQDRYAKAADLIEVRYHHLARGDIDAANQATEHLCVLLHEIGAWDDETAIITDTLTWLPDNHPRRPAWYGQLGILAQERGDYEEAETRTRQALAINERLGNQAAMANSYHQLGMLAHDRGEYEEAETRYRQALAINEQLGNQAAMANSYHQLGILAQERGDYEEAETRYHQSLAIKERLGNQAGMATSYGQLGILAQLRGDYEEAETRTRQSLAINEQLGNQAAMATSYHQLGQLAQLRGDYEEAETRYHQSLAIDERLGNQVGMATSYGQLGILAQDRGDYEEAETRTRQSLAMFERLGNQVGMANSYGQLGQLAQLRGDYEEAETRTRQSLAINERLGNQAGIATSYSVLGGLASQFNDQTAAVTWHVQALTIRLRLQIPAVRHTLSKLSALRETIPRDDFDTSTAAVVGADDVTSVHQLLDEFNTVTTAQNNDQRPPTENPPADA